MIELVGLMLSVAGFAVGFIGCRSNRRLAEHLREIDERRQRDEEHKRARTMRLNHWVPGTLPA